MLTWTIKPFGDLTTKELYELLRFRSEIFIVEQECVYNDCDTKDYHSYHCVMRDGERIVGCLRIVQPGISYKELSFGRVAVRKELRGTGLARRLIEIAVDFSIRELGEHDVRISAQQYAEGFYRKMGFETVSDPYLEDDIPHVEMLAHF